MRKVILAVLLIAITVSFAGCGSINGSDNHISKSETFWYTADDQGNQVFLTDEHPDVVAVAELCQEHQRLTLDRDYQTIKGDEEYSLYSQALLKQLVSVRDKESTVVYFQQNKLKSKFEGLEINEMSFDCNFTQCVIKTVSRLITLEATDKYLSYDNAECGKVYDRDFIYSAVKENNIWKISGFEYNKMRPIK